MAGDTILMRALDSAKASSGELSYENNSVVFTFSSLDFTSPGKNQYQVKLEGLDSDWKSQGTEGRISYNNLDAGRYIFRVRATNSDGVWSNTEASYQFEILQPWWYYVIWGLSALSVTALFLFVINRRLHVKRLHQKANYDSLTGFANRYFFNRRIEELVSHPYSRFALVIVDLDGFKEVNDVYGHSVGDELIVQAAERMQGILRENDLLARLGGDEFAVIIHGSDEKTALITITDRMREALCETYRLTDHSVRCSASIGVACYPVDASDSAQLLVYADTAMFAAKNSGRNAVHFFNEQLSSELEQRTRLRHKLEHAIEHEEFVLHYQPKINQFDNKLCGFEALIRWFQPDGSMVSPGDFIAEAERNGLIVAIGDWVIKEACRQGTIWQSQGILHGAVSVNVSTTQLTQSNIVETVANALQETSLNPEHLELEITESVLIDNIDLAFDILSELKKLGVSIALDDFGTGFSSLNYLTRFPIDTLKIDRSFIHSIELDQRTLLVLKNIYSLAHDLEMDVVAEGVESEHQLEILAKLGGDIIQGFYFGGPENSEKATQRLLAQQPSAKQQR